MPNDIISVIMGVKYRRSSTDLLKRAVDSVLCQSHKDLELIICERDSFDPARELLEKYASEDKRVRLIDGSRAGSFSEQLNLCLAEAKGDWIARMDDDDHSYPERLEKQLLFLKEHSELAFVGCRCRLVCDGAEVGTTDMPSCPSVRDFLFSQPFIHPSLLFRKQALEKVKGYSTASRCDRCEDYDLLLRMYEQGLVGCNMDEILFAYSLPPKGITNRSFRDRLNEVKTRYVRFRSLGLLPRAFPYVVKPIAVWLIPKRLLSSLKNARNRRNL